MILTFDSVVDYKGEEDLAVQVTASYDFYPTSSDEPAQVEIAITEVLDVEKNIDIESNLPFNMIDALTEEVYKLI
jgi:hypothetical protein